MVSSRTTLNGADVRVSTPCKIASSPTPAGMAGAARRVAASRSASARGFARSSCNDGSRRPIYRTTPAAVF